MTTRTIAGIATLLAIACLAAPVALADPPGPPPLQAKGYDGRSPDTKDAALAAHRQSRALFATKVVSTWPPLNGTGYDGRSQDTKDAAAAVHSNGASVAASLDGRSPDTKDAAHAAHQSSNELGSPGASFAWGEFGIGAASAVGLILLLGGIAVIARTERMRMTARIG